MGGGTFMPEIIQTKKPNVRFKKRKANEMTSPESNKIEVHGVTLQNRFQVLSDEEESMSEDDIPVNSGINSQTASKAVKIKKLKIPPIVVYSHIKNHTETLKNIQGLIKNQLSVKCKNNRVIFFTQTVEDYEKIKSEIAKSETEYHTYSLSSDKETRMVLKGIASNVTDQEILEDLQNKSIRPTKVLQLTKKTTDGEIKLPIRVVNFASDTVIKDIVKIRYICYCVCTWERFRKSKKVTQCYNCQGFGHVAKNCYKKPKCVKCAKDHKTQDCLIKNRSENPICANCGGNHAASSKDCGIYKNVWNSKFKNTKLTEKLSKINNIGISRNRISKQRNESISYASLLKGHVREGNVNTNSYNSSNSLIDDIKEIFTNFNVIHIIDIVKKTVLKLKNANDGMSKIAIIIKSLTEFFA